MDEQAVSSAAKSRHVVAPHTGLTPTFSRPARIARLSEAVAAAIKNQKGIFQQATEHLEDCFEVVTAILSANATTEETETVSRNLKDSKSRFVEEYAVTLDLYREHHLDLEVPNLKTTFQAMLKRYEAHKGLLLDTYDGISIFTKSAASMKRMLKAANNDTITTSTSQQGIARSNMAFPGSLAPVSHNNSVESVKSPKAVMCDLPIVDPAHVSTDVAHNSTTHAMKPSGPLIRINEHGISEPCNNPSPVLHVDAVPTRNSDRKSRRSPHRTHHADRLPKLTAAALRSHDQRVPRREHLPVSVPQRPKSCSHLLGPAQQNSCLRAKSAHDLRNTVSTSRCVAPQLSAVDGYDTDDDWSSLGSRMSTWDGEDSGLFRASPCDDAQDPTNFGHQQQPIQHWLSTTRSAQQVTFRGDISRSQPCQQAGLSQQVHPSAHRPNAAHSSRNPQGSWYLPLTGEEEVSCAFGDTSQDLVSVMSSINLRKELISNCSSPFTGDPASFQTWRTLLTTKIASCANLSALDILAILSTQTGGAARKLIEDYSATAGYDPVSTLQRVWAELNRRFGSPAMVSEAIRTKITNFPPIRGSQVGKQLQAFADTCAVALAHQPVVHDLLILDFPSGQQDVLDKLTERDRSRWNRLAHDFQTKNGGARPRFDVLTGFIEKLSAEENNPYNRSKSGASSNPVALLSDARLQGAQSSLANSPRPRADAPKCCLHPNEGHWLTACPRFTQLSVEQRFEVVREHRLCFRCFGTHTLINCKRAYRCQNCRSPRHHSLLHSERSPAAGAVVPLVQTNSTTVTGETSATQVHNAPSNPAAAAKSEVIAVSSNRTVIGAGGLSCGKVVLGDLTNRLTGQSVRIYCILDDQSSHTFIHKNVISELGVAASNLESCEYQINTMDRQQSHKFGHLVSGIAIRSIDGTHVTNLVGESCLTADAIPDLSSEVATPEIVRTFPHLAHLADLFAPFDSHAPVYALIGRDNGRLMSAKQFGNHDDPPFAVKTPLGYALVGVIPCSNSDHKRQISATGLVTDTVCSKEHHAVARVLPVAKDGGLSSGEFFKQDPFDDIPGLSQDDAHFIEKVSSTMRVNEEGCIEAALPLRHPNATIPDARSAMYRRTVGMFRHLKPDIRDGALKFMKATFDDNFAEPVPNSELMNRRMYLPAFPIVHPRKKSVRVVIDASAKMNGISLNQMLLTGPDSNNRLRSVLQRFREKPVAFLTDIKGMFNNFKLQRRDRDLISFWWPEGSIAGNPLAVYRSLTHTFGCASSPAVAIMGLRYAAKMAQDGDARAIEFINRGFYIDDGLSSADTVTEAIEVLQHTQRMLSQFHIRAHKFASSHEAVTGAFPPDDRAADLAHVTFDEAPIQHALGVRWEIQSDTFSIAGKAERRAFTKRGVLGTINELFDPIGLSSPVVLKGRLLMRTIFSSCKTLGWDDAIPDEFESAWIEWVDSLQDLHYCKLPRVIVPFPSDSCVERSLHGFADASSQAVGIVIYMRVVTMSGEVSVRFVTAESKVAPKGAGTIPRLELTGCVILAKAMLVVERDFTEKIDFKRYFTDSAIALAYLRNDSRRFATYVATRVAAVRNASDINDWSHVASGCNPADVASRSCLPPALLKSKWFEGPAFLSGIVLPPLEKGPSVAENLPEDMTRAVALKAMVRVERNAFSELLQRSSSLTRVISLVIFIWSGLVQWAKKSVSCAIFSPDPRTLSKVEQRELILETLVASAQIHVGWTVDAVSLRPLDPFMDGRLIRVGGRLRRSLLPFRVRHPMLIPATSVHPLAEVLIRHFHIQTGHQGRHVTAGAVRSNGIFIIHLNQAVRKVVASCFRCRRLRAPLSVQKMADLPSTRMEAAAPFEYCALDLCGPYDIKALAKTRYTTTIKCWIMVATCLYCRAVNVDVLPGLDTSTFINALRRLISDRGAIKCIYADHGSNFIGCINADRAVDLGVVEEDLGRRHIQWKLHAPTASHHGGLVERKIQSLQRIMDGALHHLGKTSLRYDELQTFGKEAAAIINSTPYSRIIDDVNSPLLSPAQLLTCKSDAHPPTIHNLTDKDIRAHGTNRWRMLQRIMDIFDENWRSQYLHELQERSRWFRPTRNFRPDDVVLLRVKASSRNCWPSAVVETVKRSVDGLVRTVSLRVVRDGKVSRLERPITELVLLIPAGEPDDDIVAVEPRSAGARFAGDGAPRRSVTVPACDGVPVSRSVTVPADDGVPVSRSVTVPADDGVPGSHSVTVPAGVAAPVSRSVTVPAGVAAPVSRSVTVPTQAGDGAPVSHSVTVPAGDGVGMLWSRPVTVPAVDPVSPSRDDDDVDTVCYYGSEAETARYGSGE